MDYSSDRIPVEISCTIDADDLAALYLIFSIDNGNSWYEAEMLQNGSLYKVTLPNIERGTKILYAFKAISKNGEEYIENNNNQYFIEIAGEQSQESELVEEPEPATSELEEKEQKISEALANPPEHPPLSDSSSKSSTLPKIPDFSHPSSEEPIEQPMLDEDIVKEPFPPRELKNKELKPGVVIDQDSQLKKRDEEKQVKEENPIEPEEHTQRISFTTPLIKEEPSKESEEKPEPVFQPGINAPLQPDLTEQKEQTPKKKEHEGEVYPQENENKVRPIIPYNPFTPEEGDLVPKKKALLSFSQIIGARSIEEPKKNRSFIRKPQLQNKKRCKNCKAVAEARWKICAICGTKL